MEKPDIYLAAPSPSLEEPFREMMRVWRQMSDDVVPWILRLDSRSFGKYVRALLDMEKGADLPADRVRCSSFFLMRSADTMLGASNIRHTLNPSLLRNGGHIGYGVRPDERNKGYATELLRLSVHEAAVLGIKKIRITCDANNLASEKVILKNNGVFDSAVIDDDALTKRYWITL